MLHRPTHTIAAHEVHVWHLLVDPAAGAPMEHAMRALLSPEEQSRLGGFRKPRDRQLFEMSRGMMRSVLASYLGCRGHEIRFAVNAFGKPILDGAPEFQFNLTHSRGAIALAVSAAREVGIDVEERHRHVEYLALAERFFAKGEASHLRTLSQEQRREAFFAIWTLKEAFVKAIGRGLTFPLDAFCFELDFDRLIKFRPLADFVSPDWHFHQFDLGERYRGAVAAQNGVGDDVTITMRDWAAVFV